MAATNEDPARCQAAGSVNSSCVVADGSTDSAKGAGLQRAPAPSHDNIGEQLDVVFERMGHVRHQASLIETFATIGDSAGVARQLKFLQVHVSAAALASQTIADLKSTRSAQ